MTADELDPDIARLGRRPHSDIGVDAAWDGLWAAVSAVKAELAEENGEGMASSRLTERVRGRHGQFGRTLGANAPTSWRYTGIGLGTLVLLCVLTFGIISHSFSSKTSAASAAAQHIKTTIGQRTTVSLADGSRVTLAPCSELIVSPGFASSSRVVTLTGEAYFDVALRPGRSFEVRTGGVTTRVLGTTFDVRKYAGDRDVRIAVLSGKVVTGNVRRIVTLTAGTIAHVTDSTITDTTSAAAHVSIDWTHGRLVFDETPVPELLATVGRWYGYSFKLADPSLATQHASTVFTLSDSAQMMQGLKALLGVTMTFDGNVVTLHATHPGVHTPNRGQAVIHPTREVGR